MIFLQLDRDSALELNFKRKKEGKDHFLLNMCIDFDVQNITTSQLKQQKTKY